MRMFGLFQLMLCIFCLYALFTFEAEMRVTVPIICLVTVFLFEMLQARLKKPGGEKVEIVQSVKENIGNTTAK